MSDNRSAGMAPVDAVPPGVFILEAGLSIIGAAVAGTLWWAHRVNLDLPCTAGGGCEPVNASRWSHVTFGPLHAVPVALLGFITYLILLTLAMAKIASETGRARRTLHWALWLLCTFGFGYSWYLQYIAHFRIDAFCIWCFSSAAAMTLLWIVATYESVRRLRHNPDSLSEMRPPAHVQHE